MRTNISPGVYIKEQYMKRGKNPKFFHKRYLKRIAPNKHLLVLSNTNNKPITPNKPTIPFSVTINSIYTNLGNSNLVNYYLRNDIGVLLQVGNNYFYFSQVYTIGLNSYYSYEYQTQSEYGGPPLKYNGILKGDKLSIKIIKAHEAYTDLQKLIEEPPIDLTYFTYDIIVNGNEYNNISQLDIPIMDEAYDISIKKIIL